ncbi:unnamed protein product [Blepharisma stoltei]|uniref:RING-type E3 ubiquitin transferase n=1 Tax=Blepharisma stoltei TaxID=1481888 RepID=A0AAU9JWQ9_9CILI|nr:unnamed protein product [Blepharisma stoltei]
MSNSTTSSSDSEIDDCVTPLPKPCASTRKRPRSSLDFFDLLICPICFDYFKPPVVNCIKGHSFCLACVDRIERLANDSKCPLCRGAISKTSRNRILEDELEKVTVGCIWHSQGCKKRISLSARQSHEAECEYCPESVICYFSEDSGPQVCKWKGNPLLLPNHLNSSHGLEPIERAKLVKFLWNPPRPDINRSRHRILRITYPSSGNEKTNFILEHVYLSEHKILLFLIRTLNSDVKLPYKICLLNRNDENNKLTFEAKTVDFSECGFLNQYPEIDKKQCFIVNYDTLIDYCFTNQDDGLTYFSFHIDFIGAGIEGVDY